MNQILDYNPNKGPSKKSSGSDNVTRVFAVILILFALCLLGSGAYGIYKKKSSEKKVATDAPAQAKISVEKKEETAVIKVSHDKAIEKLIYTWDSGKDTINKGNGESTMELEIALPAGEHVLTIKVTDIDGVESSYEDKIISENGADSTNPVISIPDQVSGTQLPVTATDETALDYVTYRWNDQEEQRYDADEENPKELKFEIEILKGKNDLTIIAVDKNNNTTTKTQSFTGVTKPDVTITINPEKTAFSVHVFHEVGIKSLKLNLNGQDFDIQLQEENPKETGFDYDLVEGDNVIKVTAESVEKTVTEATESVTRESSTPSNPDQPSSTNVEIKIVKPDDVEDKAVVSIKTDNPIKESRVNINGSEFDVTGLEGLTDGSVDCPLEVGTNRIKFTVVTENGTEKSEEVEIIR